MKRTVQHLCILFVCYLFCASLSFSSAIADQKAATVLIQPLWFHSAQDLSFLNRGVMEMLSTRLPREGRLRVIKGDKAPADDQEALETAKKAGADYVLAGGVTLFDRNVSTDIRLIETGSGRTRLTFSRFGQEPGDVLRHIDLLSAEILATLLDEKPVEKPVQAAAAAPQPLPIAPPAIQPPAATVPTLPTGIATAPTAQSPAWRSAPLDFTVISISLADVTGDGKMELAAAGTHRIELFSLQGKQMKSLARFDVPSHEGVLRVDSLDADRNGLAEIYVTGLDKDRRLKSFVLEWRGQLLVPILQDQAWFFNVLPGGNGQPARLIGQKQRLLGSVGSFDVAMADPFLPDVFTLAWQDGRLNAAQRLDLPKETDLYGFAAGTLLQASGRNLIAFDNRDRLLIMDANGRRQWQSSEKFGGSETYLEIPSDTWENQMTRYYLPQRIFLSDFNRDQIDEAVVIRNRESGRRLLERFRRYTQGEVVMLAWGGTSMKIAPLTETFEGYLSDLAMGDASGGGHPELVMSFSEPSDGMSKKINSWFVVQQVPGL